MDDRTIEIIASLRLAERAITDLLQEMQDMAQTQRDDHETIVRMQEQQQSAQAATQAMLSTVERIVRGVEGSGGLERAVQELRHGLAALGEQVRAMAEADREERASQAVARGNTVQAMSTVIAALIGAAAGIASLLLQYYSGRNGQ